MPELDNDVRCMFNKHRKCIVWFKNPAEIEDAWQYCIPCMLERILKELEVISGSIGDIAAKRW